MLHIVVHTRVCVCVCVCQCVQSLLPLKKAILATLVAQQQKFGAHFFKVVRTIRIADFKAIQVCLQSCQWQRHIAV